VTRLVYLLAASHSGSTLLAMLLGRHPEVATTGELKATRLGDPEKYRCSCGSLIRECPFWRGISAKMRERGFEFDVTNAGTDFRSGASDYARRLLEPLHRGPALELVRDAALTLSPVWRRNYPRIQALNAALASSVSLQARKPVVVDSSKIAVRLKFLLRNPELDIKVVRLIRDGRGVALTYTDPLNFADAKDPRLKAGGSGGNRDADRLPMAEAAREWRRSNEEAEALLSGLDPSRWTSLRYEELCSDPEATLKRVFAFIGVDPAATSLDFRSADHHVVGNGMRLDATEQIELDERWRVALSPADLETFAGVAGDLSRRLGYA
jgi:hypothetical protein